MNCRTTRRIRSLAAGLAAVLAVPVVASAAPQLAPSAITQLNALRSLKSTKTAVENKIDSRLFLGLLHQRNDARLAPLTDFRFVQPEADGLVPVDIPVVNAAGVKAVVNAITARSGVVRGQQLRLPGGQRPCPSRRSQSWRPCRKFARYARRPPP